MLFSQSVFSSPIVGERYARAQALSTRPSGPVVPMAGDVPDVPEARPELGFRARLLTAMAASGGASGTPMDRARAYPLFPGPGVVRSSRTEGGEEVITERVTEHVQVQHVDVGDRPSPWAAEREPVLDAMGAASAEWTESADRGRIRPHLNYLYLSATAAYMRAEQAKLWIYS